MPADHSQHNCTKNITTNIIEEMRLRCSYKAGKEAFKTAINPPPLVGSLETSATPPSVKGSKTSYAWITAAVAPLAAAPAALAASQTATSALTTAAYLPSPPGWEVYVGFAAGIVPFLIASVEFSKRILIQKRCVECNGRGLVQNGRYLKKCSTCGGLLPWLSWKAFLSANLRPGNGGPLLQPKGQSSVLYRIPSPSDDNEVDTKLK